MPPYNLTVKNMDPAHTREENQQQRRYAIVSAAVSVFLESGFDNANMVQIAQKAEVSKQTLYSHFGSKEALFKEAITSACRAHTPEGLETINNMSLEDTLRSVGRRLCELIFSEDAVRLESLCIAGASSHPEASLMYWQAGPAWVKAFLVNCLQTQIDRKRLFVDDAELAAEQFIALLCSNKKHKLLLGVEEYDNEEIGSIVDQAVTFFINATRTTS